MKMTAPEILLTEEQRLEFTQISPDISEWEIAKYYSYTDYDLDVINRHRRNYNRLGFAVQLAFLRYPGWAFSNDKVIPYRELLYNSAMENDNAMHLMQIAVEELRKIKIILPGITTLERIVVEARVKAYNKVLKIINNSITLEQRTKLDEFIEASIDNKTVLAWLKEDPRYPSPKEFSRVIDRLGKIRELQLNINIADIHPNRVRQLSRLGSK